MPEMIYSFNGKDITMNVCIQIRDRTISRLVWIVGFIQSFDFRISF